MWMIRVTGFAKAANDLCHERTNGLTTGGFGLKQRVSKADNPALQR